MITKFNIFLTTLADTLSTHSVSADAARPWQLMFQDPATPVAEGVMDFHNDLMFVVVFVGIFVGYVLARCVQLYSSDVNPVPNRVQHGTLLEIVWTITPALILMCVAFPSFALLYSVDEIVDPAVTIKAVGHQWYWVTSIPTMLTKMVNSSISITI